MRADRRLVGQCIEFINDTPVIGFALSSQKVLSFIHSIDLFPSVFHILISVAHLAKLA